MSGATAVGRRLTRPWAAGLTLLGLAAALAAGTWWWWGRPAPAGPPEVKLAGADPELVAAVGAARGRVLREPRSADAWGTLGEVLLANAFPAEADVCLARAEELDAADPRWPYLRGYGLLQRDRDVGLATLRRAVERSDRAARPDTSPYLLLAEAYMQRDDREQVEALCRRVLAWEPDNARAHFDLGLVALTHNDVEACVPHLLRAADHPAFRRQAYTQLAAACQRRGDDEAAADYARRAQQAPGDAAWPDPRLEHLQGLAVGREARFRQVHQLGSHGRLPEAADLLRRMTTDDPSDDRAFGELGVALTKLNRLAEAEKALRTAEALAPRSTDHAYFLSVALYKEGEQLQGSGDASAAADTFRAAADAARRATELKPDHAMAQLYLGLSLKRLGRRADAIECFRTAERCRPEGVAIHLALGEALAEDGRRDEALVQLGRASDLAPDDAHIRETLVRVRDGPGRE